MLLFIKFYMPLKLNNKITGDLYEYTLSVKVKLFCSNKKNVIYLAFTYTLSTRN